jgi:hypothetical protein
MDSDFFWHTLGGGAILTGVLTLARLLFDIAIYRRQQRDAETRLAQILQDRLAEADRRLARADAKLRDERVRSAMLEQELAHLRQAHEHLRLECASLVQAAEAQRLPR